MRRGDTGWPGVTKQVRPVRCYDVAAAMRVRAVRAAIAAIVAVQAIACGPPAAPPDPWRGELIDLSHTYDQATIYWPTSETFRLDVVSKGLTPGGYYYAANNFSAAEHGGTHLDAPIHFATFSNAGTFSLNSV